MTDNDLNSKYTNKINGIIQSAKKTEIKSL